MLIYYIVLILVLLFSCMASRTVRTVWSEEKEQYHYKSKFFLILLGMVLITVAGLRYYVGTDYGAYYHMLSRTAFEEEILFSLDEPGLEWLAEITRIFTSDGGVFIFLCSLITIGLICQTTYKHTTSFLFATLLIVLTGTWHGSFNGVRQYMAAAIVFAGYDLIRQKKLAKYAIVVFVAFLFHRSAIVMIIPYFVLNRKVTLPNMLMLIAGTIIISLSYEPVFEMVGWLKGKEMQIEGNAYNETRVNIFRVLASVAPAAFCIFLYKGQELSKEKTFYLNALVADAAATVSTMNSTYLARLGIYTSLCVPLALAKLVRLKDKYYEFAIRAGIVLLYFVFWYIEVSKSRTLNNFRWIWER